MQRLVMHSLTRQLGTRVWSIGVLGVLLTKQCGYPPIAHEGAGGSAAAGGSSAGAVGGASVAGSGSASMSSPTGGASNGGASTGGASGLAGSTGIIDPVIGCDAPEWPQRAEFQILPFRDPPPFPASRAALAVSHVSGDGSTVAGYSMIRLDDGTYRDYVPTIWKDGQPPIILETAADSGPASCDGSVVLFESEWWTRDGVLHPLQGGTARLISSDGAYFVGLETNTDDVLRWGPDRVAQHLGDPEMLPFGISGDGQTIYGMSYRPCDVSRQCERQVVRWNAATGMQLLYPWADYLAASSDGSTVASRALSSAGDIVIWTAATGARQFLCTPVSTCDPRALSSQGHALLVTVNSVSSIWSETHGFRSLEAVLTGFGALLDGYHLYADDMSQDGRVFVGYASRPGDDAYVTFRAVLPRAAWE